MEEVIRKAAAILGKHRIRYVVIGGIAVLAWGEPRATFDIDAVLTVLPPDLDRVIADFGSQGFVVPKDAARRLLKGLAVKLKHGVYSVDLRVSSFAVDQQAIERAKRIMVAGTRVPVASKEDLIIYKLAHFDYQDRADIEAILRRQRSIDFDYIARSVRHLAVEAKRPQIVDNLSEVLTWNRRADGMTKREIRSPHQE